MNPLQRAIKAIGLATQEQLKSLQSEASKQANRAYEAGYYDGLSNGNDDPVSGTLASYNYKQSGSGKRDFTNMSHDQLLNVAWILYQSNPLAKRYLEIVRDHVLGRGVSYSTEDEGLREIFDTFWRRNDMDANLKKFTPQLRLFGEQCFPAFVRQSDGRVTLGYIDPADIEHVVCHPQNALKRVAVVLKFDNYKRKMYRIIAEDEGYIRGNRVVSPKCPGKLVTHTQIELEAWEQYLLETNGLTEYTGSCFYRSVNNVSNQPRGFSDLLQVADWLDAHDETLFAVADREQMAAYFSWDVTLDGIDQTEVKTKAAEIRNRVPKKGQVNVHNDKEHWDMKAPDLKQYASLKTSEELADLAWGMLGMPKVWRGIGEGTNYASGLVMGEPTRKSLENKQDNIKDMIIEMLTFARDQAEIAGAYQPQVVKEITMADGTKATEDIDPGEFEVIMPEMSGADMAQVATALPQITTSLSVLVSDLRVISRNKAAEVVAKILGEIGIKYDAHEELETIDGEDEAEPEEDLATANAVNQYLNAQMKLNGNGNNANA